MNKYVYAVSLMVLASTPAFAQASSQCQKYAHDATSIFAYGMVCNDDERMQRVLKDQSSTQAIENLGEQYERHCKDADAQLFQKMEQQVLNEDAQLMQVLQNPDSDLAAFCQAKVPVIESILQKYK